MKSILYHFITLLLSPCITIFIICLILVALSVASVSIVIGSPYAFYKIYCMMLKDLRGVK
jgi:hypothetical protein